MQNNNKDIIITCILIFLIGIFFRLSGFDMFGVFAADESATVKAARQAFPFGIIDALNNQNLHTPLFYLILHFWLKYSIYEEFWLRILPALFGILCIPAAYFAGKELSSKKTGIIAAILVSINPFLIGLSKFIKFYSLLHLLGFLSVLFLIRVKNNPNKKNYAGLIISNILILYTNVLGFLFVSIQYFVFSIYLFFKSRKNLKSFIFSGLITILFFAPYIPMLIDLINHTQNSLIPYFNKYKFSFLDIPDVMYSWFAIASPDFLVSPYKSFFAIRYEIIDAVIIFFSILPTLVAFFAISSTLTRKHFSNLLLIIAVLFLSAEIIASMLGKFAFLTNYTSLVFPIILLAAAYGFGEIKQKKHFNLLVSSLVVTSISSVVFCQYIHPVVMNQGSISSAAILLKNFEPKRNDIIIMPFRGYYLDTYYSPKAKLISFDINYAYKFNRKEILNHIIDQGLIDEKLRKNPYDMFKPYLRSGEVSKSLDNYIKKEVVSKIKKNDHVYLVIHTNYFINNFSVKDYSFEKIVSSDRRYYNSDIFDLLSRKLNNDLFIICSKYLNFEKKASLEEWAVYVFKKN